MISTTRQYHVSARIHRARAPGLCRSRARRKAGGISTAHDWTGRLGGFPFEVAMPEKSFGFSRTRGFELTPLRTVEVGVGRNEFVLRRLTPSGEV